MAEACAACGRADLLSPDLANYQCLACGALTLIASGEVLVAQPEQPLLNNANLPVPELSVGVTEQPASEFVAPVDGPDPTGPVPIVTPTSPMPARVDPSYIPADAPTGPVPVVTVDSVPTEPSPTGPVPAVTTEPEPTSEVPIVTPDAMASSVNSDAPPPPV